MSAVQANNTTPLVEPDGLGGHVPYVRLDPAATATYTSAETAIVCILQDIREVLAEIRDECRATRLAVQERFNEGNLQQHDFLELAQSARDSSEEA